MTIAEKILRAKADYDEVYEAGKNSGGGSDSYLDTFWDTFQQKGQSINYLYAFAFSRFTDENYNPKYDIVTSTSSTAATYMFYYSKVTDTKVPIRVNGAQLAAAFQSSAIRRIAKLVVHENLSYSTTFQGCSALEEIYIEGVIGKDINFQWSTNLTHESLLSIIDALKDYSGDTSGTTHTITLGGNNISKLSGVELNLIEQKGWQYG